MSKVVNGMRPVHPGEVLREEFLAPLGMSANALAIELRVSAPRESDIVRERRSVTPETAVRLARYFGTTPKFWLNLQADYDLARVRDDAAVQGELASIRPREAA